MNDFLIYAARLQDAGLCSLGISLGSDKDRTRLMHVSPGEGTPPELAVMYPTRTFELCGTDRVLEALKDDMLYSDGGPTVEKIAAAIAAHPLLRQDLEEWFADYQSMPPLTDEAIDAVELDAVDEAMIQRFGDRLKHTLHGLDIARHRDTAKAPRAEQPAIDAVEALRELVAYVDGRARAVLAAADKEKQG